MGAAEASDLTGTTVGRFQIRARLGAGGMGEVYRAEDMVLKRPVALKRMAPHLRDDPTSRQRFLHEAERASRLTDAHIAGIYDVLQENGEMFLVMEYVEGETLRHRLDRPMPLSNFLDFGVQCAQALAVAHDRGILHRDIKPENIMLTNSGQAKILDFGVAREILRLEESPTMDSLENRSTGFSGTLAYMAPEVLMEQEADGRADIFSLGVVLYELLTGRHAFRSEGVMATADRIRHEEVPPASRLNPAVPAELDRILAKMLAKDRESRYATAADLAVDLRALRSGAPISIQPQRTKSRRGLAVAAAGLVILAALVSVPGVRERVAGGFRPVPAGPAATRHLAVLPFTVPGEDPRTAAFAEGLRETLTAMLSQLSATQSLQVSPANEVSTRHISTAEEARTTLGASLVLMGNVQMAGTAVRVNLTLMDTSARQPAAMRTVTADATDPFAFQDQVVDRALEMLELRVELPERQALGGAGTRVAGAYEFYLQGRGYLQDYDRPENVESAIRVFEQALALDPNFALAHTGLGESYWRKYEHTNDSRWVAQAQKGCERGIALNPNLAAARVCLGTLATGTGKYESAVQEFQEALRLEPRSDDAHRGLARAYSELGRASEAEQTYRRAIALRPQYWAGYNRLGAFYFSQKRYAEAAEQFQQVVALVPDSFQGYSNVGAAYYAQGDFARAITMFEKSIALRPTYFGYSNQATVYFQLRRFEDSSRTFEKALQLDNSDYQLWGNLGDAYFFTPGKKTQAVETYRKAISLGQERLRVNPRDQEALANMAAYYSMLGEAPAARRYLEKALQVAPRDGDIHYKAALVHNQLGESAAAMDWLEKAVAAGYPISLIRDNAFFDNLRKDPRFDTLIRVHSKP